FVAIQVPSTKHAPEDEPGLFPRHSWQSPHLEAESFETLPEPQGPTAEPRPDGHDVTGGSMASPAPRPPLSHAPSGTLADAVRVESPPCVGVCQFAHSLDLVTVPFPIFHPPCA